MRRAIDSIFNNSKQQIDEWICKQYPIDWIVRELGICRDTFRKHYPEYKGSQGFSVEKAKIYGTVGTETKKCERCGKEFNITGRFIKTTVYKKRFCSNACAKARDAYWDKNRKSFRRIAKKYYGKFKCCVCNFEKIVAIHHFDGNHENNNKENLIPLCPNHHCMIHSRYKNEILPFIEQFRKKG